LLGLLCCLLWIPVSVVCAAEGISFQDGLPPELVIDTELPLDEQAERMAAMVQWVVEHEPRPKGGLLSGLKKFFVASDEPLQLTVEDLKEHLGDAQGEKLSVVGLYTAGEEDGGVLRAGGGEVAITLGGGVIPRGFGEGDIVGLPAVVTGLAESVSDSPQPEPAIHATKIVPCDWLATMRVARVREMQGDYEQAVDAYDESATVARQANSLFSGYAIVRAAELALVELEDQQRAEKLYNNAWTHCATLDSAGKCAYVIWRPADGKWEQEPLRSAVGPMLDELNQKSFWYRVVDGFVRIAGNSPSLGVILMAIVVRLMIWPLTRKQLESARAMQDLQPQIKALQEKHVDDKKKFQEEFWKLCQEHGVNPLGGCLPMLVQLPILIMLYRGIRAYIWQFDGAGFLWVNNLAGPDMILLVAYTISMIMFQKATQRMQPTAAMNPQQAQQQQMMTYLMPIMFFFFFQTFPAAFILYWLASNMIYFGEQYMYTQRKRSAGDEEPIPGRDKKPATGFVGSMVKMLSAKDTAEEHASEDRGQRKSYAEAKAAKDGKKTSKSDKKGNRK